MALIFKGTIGFKICFGGLMLRGSISLLRTNHADGTRKCILCQNFEGSISGRAVLTWSP